jgi:hypothetical protein
MTNMLKIAHLSPPPTTPHKSNITPIPQAKNTPGNACNCSTHSTSMPNNTAHITDSTQQEKPSEKDLEKRTSHYGKIAHR